MVILVILAIMAIMAIMEIFRSEPIVLTNPMTSSFGEMDHVGWSAGERRSKEG